MTAAPAQKHAPTKPDLAALRALTAADMTRVNQVIEAQVKSDITLINDIAMHLIAAGGKRLRPALTIASAQLCGYRGDRHINLAACVEFIHTATLLHDDVVDESHLRRNEPTANAVWGNKSPILVGDFLLSRSFQLMVADGSLDVLKLLSDAAAVITAGEVHQLMVSHDLSIDQSVYEAVVAAKTAVLFAAACEIGAVVGNRPEWREPLQRYGHSLGMAFQLVDDALDYMADESALGKTIGDDFRDGKVTMPVLVAYAKATAEEKRFWERCLESGEALSAADLATAKQLLKKYDAFTLTLQRAETFAQEATLALDPLPASAAKEALLEAALFTVQRGY